MQHYKSYLQLLLVQIIFGTLPLTGKLAMRHMSPDEFIVLRIGGAALLFMALTLVLRRNIMPQKKRDWAMLAVCGTFGIALNPLFFVHGLKLVPSINSAVFLVLVPIFTLLVATVFRQEKFHWSSLFAVAFALAGVGALLGQKTHEFRVGLVGNFYFLAHTFAYALYLVMSRLTLKRYDTLVALNWMFFFAALVLVLNYLVFGVATTTPLLERLDHNDWLWLAYIVLFPTFTVYLLNLRVMRQVPSTMVGLFIYVQPLFVTLLGCLVLHEPLTSNFLVALLLILTGLAISQTRSILRRGRRSEYSPTVAGSG